MAIPVLITSAIPASCEAALQDGFIVHHLPAAPERAAFFRDVGPTIRAIAGSRTDAATMAALPNLEIIANFGVGYDGVDIAAAKARKIRVTNTPDVLNEAVAEIATGLMIALSRRIVEADKFIRAGKWREGAFQLTSELNGRTLGIVGLGRIGKAIALRAQAMRMRVVYYGRHRQPAEPYVYYDDVLAMARDCDWLIAITPGGKGTEKLISRQVLEALGPQGNFVNMSRGTVVDQPALIEMLAARKLGGAALDVFLDEPNVPEGLFDLDNVVLSPHMGSGTHETRIAMGEMMADNIKAHFAGEPLLSPVA
ncbi:MAG TPA: 2-hydroxyacid dehydrogenase [Devosiaceae bacterium]|jgi:lactate dehydrogenase-like 2-hydroxyacid dehydrogenase